MPTKIERTCLERDYRLPRGVTWQMAAERRARPAIAGIFVAVAVACRCAGWGVPYIRGAALEHP